MKGWHKAAIAALAALLLLKEKIGEPRDELAGDVLDRATVIIKKVMDQIEPCIP